MWVDGIEQVHGIHVLCNALSHFLGVLHGVYYSGLAVGHVAAGEYALTCGHAVRLLACDEESALVAVEVARGAHDGRERLVAYGHDDAVGRHGELAYLRLCALFRGRDGLLYEYLLDFVVAVDVYLLDGRVPVELGSLLDGIVVLGAQGCHVLNASVVDDVDVGGVEAQCGAGGIHGGIAAAYDEDVLPLAYGELLALQAVFEEQLHAAQEVCGKSYAVQLVALHGCVLHGVDVLDGHVERLWLSHARADEDGVEAVGKHGVDGDGLAHVGVAVYVDAHALDEAYLVGHDLLRQTVLRYAVAQYAAALAFHLEHLDGEAHAREVARHGDACRSGTDDGHLAACLLGHVVVCEVCHGVEVGDEALQLSDVDGRALLAHDA